MRLQGDFLRQETLQVAPAGADTYLERPVTSDAPARMPRRSRQPRRSSMKIPALRTDYSAGIRAALAMALCCGGLQAAGLLTATPGTVALTCKTLTGPGSA